MRFAVPKLRSGLLLLSLFECHIRGSFLLSVAALGVVIKRCPNLLSKGYTMARLTLAPKLAAIMLRVLNNALCFNAKNCIANSLSLSGRELLRSRVVLPGGGHPVVLLG